MVQWNHIPVNPQVLLGEAMNKVKWVWSSWLCFSGDCLICEQTKHFICVGQSRVIRLSFATFQRPRGSPQGGALCLQNQLESQWWRRQDPLESVPSDAVKLTSFLQQNQVFSSRGGLCITERDVALEFLLQEQDSVGPRGGVCRTTWENGGAGGVPEGSLNRALTTQMPSKRSRMKTPMLPSSLRVCYRPTQPMESSWSQTQCLTGSRVI